MRAALLTTLLLALTLMGPGAGGSGDETTTTATATVTFMVTGEHVFPFDAAYGEEGVSAECAVTVATGADAGDVLDQAVADGCVDSWDFDVFPDFGRFVTAIDGLEGHCPAWPALCSFWRFDINGQPSDTGIDFYSVQGGDEVRFHYDRGIWETVPQ